MSGEASSFQGHSRSIPDGAFSRQGHVQDSRQFLTHNWPTWGSKQGSLGRAARPSKQQMGGSASSVRNRTPSHHQVRPSPLPTVPSCGHRTLRAEASLRPRTRTHRWQNSAFPIYIVGAVNKSFRRFSDLTEFRHGKDS